jgi:hypothetical protein
VSDSGQTCAGLVGPANDSFINFGVPRGFAVRFVFGYAALLFMRNPERR